MVWTGPRQMIVDNFWSYVDKTGGRDACWPWTKGTDKAGYGRVIVEYRGQNHLTHRYAWQVINGPIPPGMHVLHRCDHPSCCNPAHLFLGTQIENNLDRDKKARFHALLTEVDVREIRQRRLAGESATKLGEEFGISQSHVSHICAYRIWKRVK
jgi:hypothetical protein